MNRDRRSDRIFEDRNDYLMFVDVLRDATEWWDIRIGAYCLLPTHSHVFIHTPKENLRDACGTSTGSIPLDISADFGLRGYRSTSTAMAGMKNNLRKMVNCESDLKTWTIP